MTAVASTTTTSKHTPVPNAPPAPPPAPQTPGDELCAAVRNNDHHHITQLCRTSTSALRDSAGHTALHWASLSTSARTLLLLLGLTRHPVDVRSHAPEQRGQTPLHWALVAGSSACVAALLQAGAIPSARDERGYTALIHCAQYGRIDLAHILLLSDPTIIDAADRDGRSALHWAAHTGRHAMTVFLSRVADPPADVRLHDSGGQTALHKACSRAHALVARALLVAGADHAARDAADRDAQACLPEGQVASVVRAELRRAERGLMTTAPRNSARAFGLVVFYYAILVLSYWFYVSYVEWGASHAVEYGTALRACAIVALVTHGIATYGDPGDLRKGTPVSCRRDIERAIASGRGDTALGPSRYCFSCLRARMPRSKHSRSRGVCVRRFDHECPWTNNAVGLKNHRILLIFAVAMLATQSLFLDQLRVALVNDKDVKHVVDAIMKRPLAVALFVLHCSLAAFCLLLLVQHAVLAAKGLTTYEQIAYRRLGYRRNPHDRGVWRNLWNFVAAKGPGTEDDVLVQTTAAPVVKNTADVDLEQVVVQAEHNGKMTTGEDGAGEEEQQLLTTENV